MNSAVITAPGEYTYSLVSLEIAIKWLKESAFVSAIGYAETAEEISRLTGIAVPFNRVMVAMSTDDEALVFRLNRILDPATKGSQGTNALKFEIGLLRLVVAQLSPRVCAE